MCLFFIFVLFYQSGYWSIESEVCVCIRVVFTFDQVDACRRAGGEDLLGGVQVGAEEDGDRSCGDGVVVDLHAEEGIDDSYAWACVPLERWPAVDDSGRGGQSLQKQLNAVFAVGVDCPSEGDALGLLEFSAFAEKS